MKKVSKKFFSSKNSKVLSALILLIIVLAIPLTVVISQKQQEVRQHAAACLPKPACLNAKPPCMIAVPAEGWCPIGPSPIVSFSPRPSRSPFPFFSPRATCLPRPACLDKTPRCLIAEPANGWCKSPAPSPITCAHVITPAKNPYSGQCLNFPTSCIPYGWTKVASCGK